MEWEQTGSPFPWLGESTTLNSGASRKDGAASVSWLTSTDLQHLGYCLTLNLSEQPRTANPTKLSEILVTNPDPKYRLSAKACQGILNRAERRGKELPPELKAALLEQSASKNEPESLGGGKGILIQPEHTGALSTLNNQSVLPQPYGISSYDSNAMKSPNPHSGIYKADTSRTLDLTGGSPACNQGGWQSLRPLRATERERATKETGTG